MRHDTHFHQFAWPQSSTLHHPDHKMASGPHVFKLRHQQGGGIAIALYKLGALIFQHALPVDAAQYVLYHCIRDWTLRLPAFRGWHGRMSVVVVILAVPAFAFIVLDPLDDDLR